MIIIFGYSMESNLMQSNIFQYLFNKNSIELSQVVISNGDHCQWIMLPFSIDF